MEQGHSSKIVVEGFECPSCRGTSYEAVCVPTPDFDGVYDTGVFRCTECRLGFINPEKYSKHAARRR